MTDETQTPARLAVVINPSKIADDSPVHDRIEQAASANGFGDVHWYETTIEDSGAGQARRALDDGATLVVAYGGDGTIRRVAQTLSGSGVPMGLVPAGTGNLLARALATPLDLDNALDVAFAGHLRCIDVGEVACDGGDPEVFLVMAGLGLDADTMVLADDGLKKRFGWLAYVVSGVQALVNKGFRVWVRADGSVRISQHARTVMVGNVGQIQGGVMIMPEALLDDGKLDVLLASPRGLSGWGALLLDIVTRHHRGHKGVRRVQAEEITVRTRTGVEAQIDGDPVGAVHEMVCRVRPSALVVLAAPAEPTEPAVDDQ